MGGVGLRRGRRHPDDIRAGESLDFWGVEEVQPDRSMRLRAEMKLPGKAWLELDIEPAGERNRLSIVAHYYTESLIGRIYWYIFVPFHHVIFSDLIRQIEKRA